MAKVGLHNGMSHRLPGMECWQGALTSEAAMIAAKLLDACLRAYHCPATALKARVASSASPLLVITR